MKAILLAGGMGTRLRPLTVHTPKPVVPIFNRPFLHYQIDLVKRMPEIDEIILSLNYQPDQIQEVFGDGSDVGIRLRYVVEPSPLGTGGAIKYAAAGLTGSVIVFNGDVLTEVDLADVVRLHRARGARATIVLTPVDNPSSYGLVETDPDGAIRRFLEKPPPEDITTNRINAGIYVLETDTFDRIPDGVPWSIERGYFPSLVERRETFVGYVYTGYWIDIGAPPSYARVHRDIMDGRFGAEPFRRLQAPRTSVSPAARVASGATVEGPCFIDDEVTVSAGARVGAYSVIGRETVVAENAVIDGAIIWPGCRIGRDAQVRDAILGRRCTVGESVTLNGGAVIGDGTTLSAFTRA